MGKMQEQLVSALQSYAETYGLYEGKISESQMLQVKSFINFFIHDWLPSRSIAEKPIVEFGPQDNVVLQTYEHTGYPENKCDALVFVGGDVKPFVAAYGYDETTGEWSHGTYCSYAWEAEAHANPRILDDLNSPWEVDDIEEQLESYGLSTSQKNVVAVKAVLENKFQEQFVEEISRAGYDMIREAIEVLGDSLEPDKKVEISPVPIPNTKFSVLAPNKPATFGEYVNGCIEYLAENTPED